MSLTPNCSQGLDALAHGHRRLVDPHHERHVRPVDVSIHQAGLIAKLAQRNSQIDGHCGLTDAAFAGSDGDQILNSGNRKFRLLLVRIGGHGFYPNSKRR